MEKIRQEELQSMQKRNELEKLEAETRQQEEKMEELLKDDKDQKGTKVKSHMVNGGQIVMESPRVRTPRRSSGRSREGLMSTAGSVNLSKDTGEQ